MNLLSILHFENLAEGIMVTIIGFGIVFAVLIFICLILMLSGRLLNEKPKTAAVKPAVQPVQPNATIDEGTAVDDAELIAVIAAAISASEGKSIGPDRLVVRRLRRTQGWNKEAIAEQQSRLF